MFHIQDPADWVRQGEPDMLSVVIPAHNEESELRRTIPPLVEALDAAGIGHEILVVNDHSTDGTAAVLDDLEGRFPTLRHVDNPASAGFGLAIRCGLLEFKGDVVVVVMADGSDAPEDVVAFHRRYREGVDCVFGSRFIGGGKVVNYPLHKLILNRLANLFIRALFGHGYNDTTNAFKMYGRHVIAGLQPLLSHHFNLTVELPLKVVARNFSFAILPCSWHNRKTGTSSLKIQEMGSRYLFIVLYCLLEKALSRGDYVRGDGGG